MAVRSHTIVVRCPIRPAWLVALTLSLCGCPPPPSAPPTPQPGSVAFQVTSRPTGASASVDGLPRGDTPVQVQLLPGMHRVKLSRAGYFDLETDMDVAAGGSFEGALVVSH